MPPTNAASSARGSVAGREQALAQHLHDGRHALGDERVEQLLLAAEVVVDESGGDAGLQRDAAQARGGDAVGGEARDGRVEQPLALVRFVGARPAGAARLALSCGGLLLHGAKLNHRINNYKPIAVMCYAFVRCPPPLAVA